MPGEEVKYQSIVKPSRAIVDIRQSRGVSRAMLRLGYMLLAAWLPALAEAQESTPPEASPYGGNVWSRATLGGDWGGVPTAGRPWVSSSVSMSPTRFRAWPVADSTARFFAESPTKATPGTPPPAI